MSNPRPEPTDLHVLQGATYTMTVTYGTGTTDISAYTTARLSVADGYKDTAGRSVAFTLSQSDGIDLTNANTGVVVVTLSATRTGALTDLNYFYDLELEDSGGNVLRLIFGKVYVYKQTTD